jgi:hypothetical protein
LTFLSTGQVWLQGLRKDEKLKLRGVGKILTKYFLNYLKNKDIRSLRFSTYIDNIASIKFNEALGFQHSNTFSLKTYELNESVAVPGTVITAGKKDLTEIENFIAKSEFLKASQNLISKGWTLYNYDQEYLHRLLEADKIIITLKNNKISGIMICEVMNYQEILWISFLEAVDHEAYYDLFESAKAIAVNLGKKEIQLLVPAVYYLLEQCNLYGFTSWQQESDVLLYEYPVDKLN